MFKKLMIVLVTAALTFGVLKMAYAASAYATVSNAYWHNGSQVYSVRIHNPSRYRIYCTLAATNGAYYDGYISPWSKSGGMRIGINASYNYSCRIR